MAWRTVFLAAVLAGALLCAPRPLHAEARLATIGPDGNSDIKHDYFAVCVFVQTVEAFVLPDLSAQTDFSRAPFRLLSASPYPNEPGVVIERYSFAVDGVSGEIDVSATPQPKGKISRRFNGFRAIRFPAGKLPASLRRLDTLQWLLGFQELVEIGDTLAFACEFDRAVFHFVGKKLSVVEFEHASAD